jgi:lysozyme
MGLLNVVVDLYHDNEVSSFRSLRTSGIYGVIHKATQGTKFVDDRYWQRRKQALDVGLMWGAYHFGVARNGKQQADHFLDVVSPDLTDLIVLDFEPNPSGPTMTRREAEDFVMRVLERTNRFPALYGSQDFLKRTLAGNQATILTKCSLWIARYSSQLPDPPPPFSTYALWQYTNGVEGPEPHHVNGVVGPCDRNKFNGDLAALRKFWGISDV